MRAARCFLARFSDKACVGRLVKAHLLPRRLLKTNLRPADALRAIEDPRSWVWACGGPMGNAGHHGMLDTSRTLKVPRLALPLPLEQLAIELDLAWYLDREFGPAPHPAVVDCPTCASSGELCEPTRDPQDERPYPCPRCGGFGGVRVAEVAA